MLKNKYDFYADVPIYLIWILLIGYIIFIKDFKSLLYIGGLVIIFIFAYYWSKHWTKKSYELEKENMESYY